MRKFSIFNFQFSITDSRSGQSLIEIIIGLAIGSLLIGAAAFAISAMLQANLTNQKGQAALAFSQELLNKAKAYGSADWQNLYGLQKSSSTQYFLNATGTSYFVVKGKEGVLDNDVVSGLVAQWKFDEDAGSTSTITYDATVNGNNGTLINSPTRATSTCKIGNCMRFSGSNRIDLPNNTNYDFSNQDFTVSAWISLAEYYSAATTCKSSPIVANDDWGWHFSLDTTGHVGFGYYYNASNGAGVASVSIIPLNTYKHLVGVFSKTSSKLQVYIDGVLDNEATISNATIYYDSNDTPHIGAITGCGGQDIYYKGSIDDVRIYNRALSAAEVKQLYNSNIFSRFFYVENACRTNDASSSISGVAPCGTGSSDDPSTQKVTSVVQWTTSAGAGQAILSDFTTRWKNAIFRQTDWSGGVGGSSPVTTPGNTFSSSSGADFTNGSLRIQGL